METEKDIELGIASEPPSPSIPRTLPHHTRDTPDVAMTSTPHELEHNGLHTISTQYSNHISLAAVEPVDIQIRDLAVQVDTAPSPLSFASLLPKPKGNGDSKSAMRTLIYEVGADMPRSTLTAIIGGSGSGKTTMLNTVAERVT